MNDMDLNKNPQICDIEFEQFKMEPFILVIFGGAGDLSKRKLLPTVFHLYQEEELKCGCSVVGFGKPDLTDNEYRKKMRESLDIYSDNKVETKSWNEFTNNLWYVSSSFDNLKGYKKLKKKIQDISQKDSEGKTNVIFYMAVPPVFAPQIIKNIKESGLNTDDIKTKVIVEKPFGRDQKTAKELNSVLNEVFDEKQIYRIDHYLGKETVQNIIFFRFSNSIFEPLWNYKYIDNVQITVAEDIGIEHRGEFYENAGVVRDIIQNHVMQLIGHIAMEPPVGFSADYIRDEKVKVFKSIRLMDEKYIAENTVIGQYGAGTVDNEEVTAYRNENNVKKDSVIPTFMAAKLYIDNWRWAGVPFYIRSGKRMPKRVTEICVQFKQPPLRLFSNACEILEPNLLIITIQPKEMINIRFGVKYPMTENQIYPVNMHFNYVDAFDSGKHLAYERLLIDCMKGDQTLFVRQDGVERMWGIVDPLLKYWERDPEVEIPIYRAGTWGPHIADELIEKDGRHWFTK